MNRFNSEGISPHHSGFALPIVLGLLSLTSLWGTLLFKHMHLQIHQLVTMDHEKKVFYTAQAHLNQCAKKIPTLDTELFIEENCCLIEDLSSFFKQNSTRASFKKSQNKLINKYYRVSVHHELLSPSTNTLLSSARLQASYVVAPDQRTIVDYSWREIVDMTWEKDLSLAQAGSLDRIWQRIPACQHTELTL